MYILKTRRAGTITHTLKEDEAMNPEKIICPCKKVTKGQILKAMAAGAHGYKEISKVTGAGSKCGKCEDEVRKFIKKHKEK